MPFTPKLWPGFTKGVVLATQPDDVPEDALRVARNVRLDSTLLTVCARPGMTRMSATQLGLPSAVDWLEKLYGISTDYSYAHFDTTLDRLTDDWTAPAVLSASAGSTMTAARLPSGASPPLPHIYFASSGGPLGKDSGTAFTTWGIGAPTAVVTTALAADLTTSINTCEVAGDWTVGAGVAVALDANVFVENANSIQLTVNASTLGTAGMGSGKFVGAVDLNLDTLTGGDNTVKNDDYIHFWIRMDRPERLVYMQLDMDLDTNTYANAFRGNYYTAVLPQSAFLDSTDTWQRIQIRKSAFNRAGTGAATWATVKALRFVFYTNSLGTLIVHLDDIKLRGGVGMEGDMEYTVVYRNSTTKSRGNPYILTDVVQYSTKLTTDRQRITVTFTDVKEGGAGHPGDAQIDKMWLFRKGSQFDEAVKVTEIADTTATYTDVISDVTLLLDPIVLEVDNDTPPTGGTVVFGPGPFNRLFLLENGYRLRYSKAWERDENRVENWPVTNDVGIGDGGQRAVTGIATDTQVFVWTEALTYQVLGAGTDTFLAVPIPDSRGIVGVYAVAAGGGRVFFVAQDGLYEQVGLNQRPLSLTMAPFFRGERIDGNPAWTTSTANRALTRLMWYADVNGPMLVMLYLDTTGAWRRLIVKSATGTQYDTFLFDDTEAFSIRSLMVDHEDNHLLGGGSLGYVYKLEDHTVSADAGNTISGQVRTRSEDFGLKRQQKRYTGFVVEGDTNQVALVATAYYDKNTASEVLGTVQTDSVADRALITVGQPGAKYYDAALDLAWSTINPVTISLLGVYGSPVAESAIFYDSDRLTMPTSARLDRVELDLEATQPVTLTIYSGDTVVAQADVLPTTSGRARVTYVPPGEIRSRYWRYTLRSSTAFWYYTTPPEAALKLVEPAEVGATLASGRLTSPETRRLDRLEFDIDAPSPVVVTVYTDESTMAYTTTVPATAGRKAHVTVPFPTELRSTFWRYTLSSVADFELYTTPPEAAMVLVEPAAHTVFFDSGPITTPFVEVWKSLEYDMTLPSDIGLSYTVDGILRYQVTIPATSGRVRKHLYLPPTARGRLHRVTMTSSTPFDRYSLLAWRKPLGSTTGYQPLALGVPALAPTG